MPSELVSEKMIHRHVHVGDGVYASFDGYQIRLDTNSPYQPTDTVYLPLFAFDNLLEYVENLRKEFNTDESKNSAE